MTDRAASLQPLIDQVDQLISAAKSVGSRTTSMDAARNELATDYLSWFNQCKRLLHPDLVEKFSVQYEGYRPGNIRKFLQHGGEITASGWRRGQSYTDYKAPIKENFLDPITNQRQTLLESQARYTAGDFGGYSPVTVSQITIFERLHPEVQKISESRFRAGNFNDALFRACQELVVRVQQKSGLTHLDNTPLMQQAFSPDKTTGKPPVEMSSDVDEQKGYMWLFSGMTMAIRNVIAHPGHSEPTPDEALEKLAFISMLWRSLDRA